MTHYQPIGYAGPSPSKRHDPDSPESVMLSLLYEANWPTAAQDKAERDSACE